MSILFCSSLLKLSPLDIDWSGVTQTDCGPLVWPFMCRDGRHTWHLYSQTHTVVLSRTLLFVQMYMKACLWERDKDTEREITSHLEAGKMCLFFSYQCLSTTFPACDCRESKVMNQLNLPFCQGTWQRSWEMQLNVFQRMTMLLSSYKIIYLLKARKGTQWFPSIHTPIYVVAVN